MPRISEVAVALAAFSGAADAFWRMPCRGRTALGRIDPIMDYGALASHSHTLQGGNAIGLKATSESMLADSTCTSCQINQDKSAYWTPNLYFHHESGEFEPVSQAGGMLAYYLLYGDNIKPFPSGFQMISGDTHRRNFTAAVPEPPKAEWTGYEVSQDALSQKALGFNCMNYKPGVTPEPSLGRHFLPKKDFIDANCPDGLRFEIMFPSCWNGKDVDSPDHKSHMAFPDAVMGGNCPSGFETRVPSLFYETIWNTQQFSGQAGEFVISNGDPTGFGYHADFLEGWQQGFLQQAIGTCTSLSGVVEDCPIFDIVSDADMDTCTAAVPDIVTKENAGSMLSALPGDNPIARGPEPAGSGSGSGHVASAVSSAVSGLESGASSLLGGGKKQNKVAAADVPSSAGVSAAAAAAATPACASHKTVVKGQEAWDICIEEEVVQITKRDPQPTGAAVKRHLHHHAHKQHHA